MIYIHYCQNCCHIHILNGHKTVCPVCDRHLNELRISYMEYIDLSRPERQLLLRKLTESDELFVLK